MLVLGDLLGMTFPAQLYGNYFINHESIPSLNNQDSMGSNSCFLRGNKAHVDLKSTLKVQISNIQRRDGGF